MKPVLRRATRWLVVTLLLAGAPAFGAVTPVELSFAPASSPYLLAQNDWNQLSEQEKQLLKDHRNRWDKYPPDYRSRLRQGAERYQGLSPDERERLQRGRERYKTLPPDERERLKRKYQERQER
ncbi:MAG: hypothetical protein A2150_06645 [Candidatus Muproteobacteria bacterium RBG_16_64_11]|uniref:DUF3106 domain-containing protein n=1 Tax=Candidatus Muproteobacteria bacterium RBG_16_64_11 TaxID=1817758 RepID=A0A1F6TDU3_9PROT|nr:MAG: hypothetical protein A2150_06645 [Candidatus Muproteobacteria bacterium RBG_16_64_11]